MGTRTQFTPGNGIGNILGGFCKALLPMSMIGLVASFFISFISDGLSEFPDSNFELENGDIEYTLQSANTVQAEEGKVDYVFDFQSRTIAMDGPGSADGAFLFSQFENAAALAAANDTGCRISQNVLDTVAQEYGADLGEAESDWVEAHERATSFMDSHCPR